MKDDKNKKIGLSKILFYALILLPIAVCIWGIAQGESLAAAIQSDIKNGQISMGAGSEFEQEYQINEAAGQRPDLSVYCQRLQRYLGNTPDGLQ